VDVSVAAEEAETNSLGFEYSPPLNRFIGTIQSTLG
jgi:hypothetical protein